MATIDHAEPRTYGGWRRPKGFGLGALGTLGTALLFGDLLLALVVLLATGAIVPSLVLGLTGLAVVGAVSWPDSTGRTGAQRAGARAGYLRARLTGAASYRSGPLVQRVGTFRLPGLGAQTELLEATDTQGRPFAVVRVPSTRDYTIVLACDPDGASLVDERQVDKWVSHYGRWLAALGREPQLVGASVTIETAPDTGSRLRREVEGHLAPDAPSVAQNVMRKIARTFPAGSATTRVLVALTFTSQVHRRRTRQADEVTRDLGNRLPYLAAALQATGAGAIRPVSAAGVCELVRVAYDPDAAAAYEQARALGETIPADWSNAGPAATEARWDFYRHDSGVSCSWEMVAAPRGAVTSGVLDPLLRPHPDCERKRITLVYKPVSAAESAKIVEKDRDHATSRVRAARKPGARATDDLTHAERAAMEEAQGAGLVNIALLATATVSDPEQLDAARLAVEQLAPAARVTLRRVNGSQDSVFTAALPIGVVLDRHVRVPAMLRGAL